MEIIRNNDVFKILCKLQNKWGIYLSRQNDESDLDELRKACPKLDEDSLIHLYLEDSLYCFFNSYKEMNDFFWTVIGDDGPTPLNDYNGECRVYALTCDTSGNALNENT